MRICNAFLPQCQCQFEGLNSIPLRQMRCGNLLHPNAGHMPHATVGVCRSKKTGILCGILCGKPFLGPGYSKSLRTLRCRDYLVRLRLQGIWGGRHRGSGGLCLERTPSGQPAGQFSRLAINAIRRTIVRHAKRGRGPFWA